MRRRPLSLRMRLLVLILLPLALAAAGLGLWRYQAAQRTAAELFDRSLLATALAISRDVAISGGDALSSSTRALIEDASGGEVFYHVTAPDGVHVTGYAYPPVERGADRDPAARMRFYEAVYRGEPVRVLRIVETMAIGPMVGDARVRVWQRLAEREAFARGLALRAAALMGMLLAILALVVWFSVHLGLHPLRELHRAIARRSPDDLSRIEGPVPAEARGIVDTLNRLLGQVSDSIAAHQAFISDAAHQLRNPTAGLLAMAEALEHAAPGPEQDRRRAELVQAARRAARVTEQLLSMERLAHDPGQGARERVELNALVEEICAGFAEAALRRGIGFAFEAASGPLVVEADPVFLGEALKNLLDNALVHGGAGLAEIAVETGVETGAEGRFARITVSDDGKPLPPEAEAVVFRRFAQLEPGAGSGLGLAFAATVAEKHGGRLRIDAADKGASLSLLLPLAPGRPGR
ncbi:sensor histidine kinase [Paralimibaculum aggregatum]|uniref:histidine kinase n=1 Tax=Paralimibaculum aggregatum TaxID=3036245 RepID=A0ABQ6LDV3_9RHOB|nr:sensor histidine kinase [Limibaculum sp. NKW23]GMG81526.1 sensor histidine kinase [Limibaculum sp. NKW23]